MMLSEAIVSFREPARGSMFPPNAALDEADIMLGGRNTPNFISGKTPFTDDDLTIVNFVRRATLGREVERETNLSHAAVFVRCF